MLQNSEREKGGHLKTGESATRRRSSIDWNRVRRMLETAEAAIRLTGTPSPEEVRKVLKARAREMARESIATGTAERIEVVEFLLAGETYAVESRYVRAIHPLTSLAPLPCTPSFVLGIANVRGEILSVVDIGKFFELPGEGLTNLNKLIALWHPCRCHCRRTPYFNGGNPAIPAHTDRNTGGISEGRDSRAYRSARCREADRRPETGHTGTGGMMECPALIRQTGVSNVSGMDMDCGNSYSSWQIGTGF